MVPFKRAEMPFDLLVEKIRAVPRGISLIAYRNCSNVHFSPGRHRDYLFQGTALLASAVKRWEILLGYLRCYCRNCRWRISAACFFDVGCEIARREIWICLDRLSERSFSQLVFFLLR